MQISAVADDDFGNSILENITNYGIDVSGVEIIKNYQPSNLSSPPLWRVCGDQAQEIKEYKLSERERGGERVTDYSNCFMACS